MVKPIIYNTTFLLNKQKLFLFLPIVAAKNETQLRPWHSIWLTWPWPSSWAFLSKLVSGRARFIFTFQKDSGDKSNIKKNCFFFSPSVFT